MFTRIRNFNFILSPIKKTRRRLIQLVISILVVSVLLPGASWYPAYAWNNAEIAEAIACTDPLGCVEIAPGAPVHIAYALAISGSVSYLGIDERNGVEIAIDDVGGQILGHAILFDGVDSGCSNAGGLAAGTALAADPTIVAVIGTSCSSAAMAAMPVLSAAGFSMISPSNTFPSLTEPGNPNNYPGYLRTSWNDRDQAPVAARFAREYLGVSAAATIEDGSPYSDYLQNTFVNEFTSLGGTITNQLTISVGQTNMSGELATIAAGHPGLIYMPIFMPEGGYIINQAGITPGLESTFLLGSDGLYGQDVVNATGQNVEGFMVTGPDTTKYSVGYTSSFLPAYYTKFGYEPTSMFHIYAYDAFMLVKSAIETAAIVEPDNTIQIGRQALRDALYATTNFPGLTGTLTCSPTGDCADIHMGLFEYHASQYPPELIWPYSFGDVSSSYWAWKFIERLYNAGITGGCSITPLSYCPENQVTRAQMSIFLEKGVYYPSGFTPPNVSPTFIDTVGHWAEDWIEALRSDGITGGCGLNLYCPENPVTRAQMAVFLLKSKKGSGYTPPAVGSSTGFNDVPVTHWAAPWIKQLALEGITGGCGGGNYCPDDPVTRAQMAVFLVKTFNLP